MAISPRVRLLRRVMACWLLAAGHARIDDGVRDRGGVVGDLGIDDRRYGGRVDRRGASDDWRDDTSRGGTGVVSTTRADENDRDDDGRERDRECDDGRAATRRW